MKPIQRYQQDLDEGLISVDQCQRVVVEELQRLFDELEGQAFVKPGLLSMVTGWLDRDQAKSVTPKGIYLWGGVGRGKTYLMDLFFDCLPTERKFRTHFHRFMQRIHNDLAKHQGVKNPLEKVAEQIASEASVVCFDEFFVLDIADAMILAGLLDALFARGVVLVTTSNILPDGLYENGLQRQRFLPAIELIKHHTQVIEIATGIDYRLRSLSQATLYHQPIGETTAELLEKSFYDLAPDQSEIHPLETIEILERTLQTRFCADDVVWFDFAELCDGPRSAFDYVELAKLFHALILSDVPKLDASRDDQARRFIALVDELYDRRVKLIISAEAPIQELYSGQALGFAFERTSSRLLEMQSQEYLASEHRA